MLLYGSSLTTDEPILDERHTQVPTGAAGARAARAAIHDALHEWGWGDAAHRACLCATELVADLEEASDDVELVVSRGAERVVVELRDAGGGTRFHDLLTGDAARARSIAVIDGTVPLWGVRPLSGGDAVWFELRRQSDTGPASDRRA